METKKIMKHVNKFVACLLMVTMLFGIVEPFGVVKAEGAQDSGTLTIASGYATGAYAWGYGYLQFSAANTGSLTAGQLIPDGGDITWNGESVFTMQATGNNTTTLWDKFSFTSGGLFELANLDWTNNGKGCQNSDCITIEGQFKTTDGKLINFQKTTFQYIGSNKWRIYTEPVSSGALILASESLDGTNEWGWGGFRFKTANGYVPAPKGLPVQKFQSDGGTITIKADASSEEVALTLGTEINLKSGDTDRSQKYYIEDYNGGAFAAGNIITIQGKFKTEDGFSIEFPKTSFMYEGVTTDEVSGTQYKKWSHYNAVSVSTGELDVTDDYKYGNSISHLMLMFKTKSDVELPEKGKLTAVPGSGELKYNDLSVPANVGFRADNTSGVFAVDNFPSAMNPSDTISVKGKFTLPNGTIVEFPETTFKYMGINGNDQGYWTVLSNAEVISIGELDVTDAYKTGNDYSYAMLEFKAMEDITWPVNSNTPLTAMSGSDEIIYDGVNVTGVANFKATGTKGVFQIDGLENTTVGSPKESVVLTVKGQFKLTDDYIMEFPETTFKYMGKNGNGKGYWRVISEPLTDNYVNSGTITVHSNSSSAHTDGQFFYFQTEDRSLPADTSNTGYLRPESGSARVTYQNPGEDEKDLTSYNNIFSYSGGVYTLWTLHAAKDGAIVNLQGKFATADGSIGIDFQPVTFRYVAVGDKGYWVTVGTSFTSDIYWEAENAYEEEIQAFEATVRLSKNAEGGVILGTNRDSNDTYTFGVDAAGAPYLALRDGATTVEYKFANINVCTGNWVTMRIVREGTNVKYYENGTLKATLENQTAVSVTPTAKATVGGNYTTNNANYFKGSIKDVTVYADATCTQKIASYDMSVVASNTKMIADGNDSKKYDIIRTLRWLNPDEVSEPSNYAYSFAVVGDTQAINDKYGIKNGQLYKIYDYIVEHEDDKKIKFVFGLGDITEYDDESEWKRAQAQIQKLDAAGIPYNLNRGNHDGSTQLNTYFAPSDKLNVYSDGKIENSYQTLTIGNVNYLIFALDYNPSDEVLNWAGSIIEDHSNYNVIITTHGYMTAKEAYTSDAEGGGERIWNNLAKKYSNVVLVLSGHVFTNDIVWNQVKGENGNVVTQMVINPQTADALTDGGTGMVAMLYFSEDGKTVKVRYYSTIREQYLADTNQFSLDLIESVTVRPYTNVKTQYRQENNYKAPTLQGYLFAGWYTNESCAKEYALTKDSVVDDETTYYAKFVDAGVMKVNAQISAGTTSSSTSTKLRLVFTVDTLDYSSAGFLIAIGNSSQRKFNYTTVYRTLKSIDITYEPSSIRSISQFFVPITIANIPNAHFGTAIWAQPYWATLDGTTVVGENTSKTVEEGIDGTPYYENDESIELAAFMGPRRSGYRIWNGEYGMHPNDPVDGWNSFITEKDFQDYIDAGFTYTIPEGDAWYDHDYDTNQAVDSFEKSDLYDYMEMAEKMGLAVLPSSNYIMNTIAFDKPTTLNDEQKGHLDKLLNDLSKYKSFKGLTMLDEPDITMADTINAIQNYVREKNKNLSFYTCKLPLYSDIDKLTTNKIMLWLEQKDEAYKDYINAFSSEKDIFAYDYYPLYIESDNVTTSVKADYYKNMELVVRNAKGDTGIVVQSSEWGSKDGEQNTKHTRTTNKADISFQVYSALAYGMKYINYYTYWEHYSQGEEGTVYNAMVMYPEQNGQPAVKTDLYYAVQAVNREIKKFDHVFLKYDWQGTVAVSADGKSKSSLLKGVTSYSSSRIASVSATEEAIIGCMKDDKGYDGFMIVNATDPGQKKSNTVTVTFNNAKKALCYINGERSVITLDNGKFQHTLTAGQGIFVIPVAE